MDKHSDRLPTEALEDVAYLSRSANRVTILDGLTREPSTRRELEERTGVSRTTLDRIVNELEARGWAERTTDGDYAATPRGELLIDQFTPFLESVTALRRLDEAVAWLPTDELSIGLEHFSDAVVREPANDDPVETNDYFTDLVRDAAEVHILTHLAPPAPVSMALRDGLVSGRLTARFVVTDDAIEYLRAQQDRRERWREMIDVGADLYRTAAPIPCNLFIFGETVLIKKSGPEPINDSYGVPIVSQDETVRSWAHDLVSRNQSDAIRVDAEAFADESRVHRAEFGER